MRLVEWTDGSGYKHISRVRDTDPDEMAPYGVLLDPPDIHSLDWREIKKNLHNALVERRLSTWRDVQHQKGGLHGAILSALKRPLAILYKNSMDMQSKGG